MFEDLDELATDDLALLLGIGNAGEGLEKSPRGKVDLRVALQILAWHVNPFDRRVVGDDLVKRPLPDEDRLRGRHLVERLAIDIAMPDTVEAPGHDNLFVRAFIRQYLGESCEIVLVARHRRTGPVRQHPFHRGDKMAGQQDRAQGRMQVWVDEAGHQHVVLELPVDPVRMVFEPRRKRLERARLNDPAIAHCNGRGFRLGLVHRDDFAGGEDCDLGHVHFFPADSGSKMRVAEHPDDLGFDFPGVAAPVTARGRELETVAGLKKDFLPVDA